MTNIAFYSNVADKLLLLASLVQAALNKRRKVTVLTENAESAQALSAYLWQHDATSFLPHVLADHPHAASTPVIIASQINAAGQSDVITQDEMLINLTAQEPASFSRFVHLLELVGHDEADKLSARQRYKFYRDRGYEIKHIDQTQPNTKQPTLTSQQTPSRAE